MGAIASSIEGLNPLSVVKSGVHDLSVFVLNSCRSECDCCGCLHWYIQTNETHEDDGSGSSSSSVCCGE